MGEIGGNERLVTTVARGHDRNTLLTRVFGPNVYATRGIFEGEEMSTGIPSFRGGSIGEGTSGAAEARETVAPGGAFNGVQ